MCAVGGATQHPLVPLPRVPGPPTEKMSGLAGKKGRPSPRTGRRGKRNNQVLYRERLAAEEAKQKKAEESRKAARSRGAERRQAAFTEVQRLLEYSPHPTGKQAVLHRTLLSYYNAMALHPSGVDADLVNSVAEVMWPLWMEVSRGDVVVCVFLKFGRPNKTRWHLPFPTPYPCTANWHQLVAGLHEGQRQELGAQVGDGADTETEALQGLALHITHANIRVLWVSCRLLVGRGRDGDAQWSPQQTFHDTPKVTYMNHDAPRGSGRGWGSTCAASGTSAGVFFKR